MSLRDKANQRRFRGQSTPSGRNRSSIQSPRSTATTSSPACGAGSAAAALIVGTVVGGVGGTLFKGEGFVPSQHGSVVYLNAGDDLNPVLDRVAGAGGKVLLEKTEIGGGRGFLDWGFMSTTGDKRVAIQYSGAGVFSPISRTPKATASGCTRCADGLSKNFGGGLAMGVTKLYSADVFVNDVDRAIDFFVDTLGFEKRFDEPFGTEGHRWVEVAPAGSDVSLVLARGFGHWTPERVGGYVGLILSVDDMASTYKSLKAQGVVFGGEPEGSPWGIFAEMKDPDGNVFVLHQAPRG